MIILVLFLTTISTTLCVDITLLNVLDFQKYESSFDIKSICKKYLPEIASGASEDCAKQLKIVCQNETILLTMLDAVSKFPYAGILVSGKTDNGNYEECVRVDHTEKIENSDDDVRVLGKHCTGGFIIPISSENVSDYFLLATCIPHKCSAEDLINITNVPLFSDYGCVTKESIDYTTGDKIIIGIFAFFGLLVIISTMYDIILHEFERQPPCEVLLAFSLLTNGKKLFQTTKQCKEQISVFNGIRFYSMCWVIAGHSYIMWSSFPLFNVQDATDFINKYYSLYISSAHLAVDTFFYISGFLFAYQYFKEKAKPAVVQIKQVPLLYIHRYIRLTPAVLMVYLFYVGIVPHIVSGPAYPLVLSNFLDPCYDHWWALFGYFQNYYSPGDTSWCIATTWYLCADMQMFMLAPLVAIPVSLHLKNNFKVTMIALLCMNVFFTLLPLFYVIWPSIYRNEFATDLKLIDYGVGFMMGTFMREKKHQPFKFNKITNLLIWTFCIALLTGIILILKAVELHSTEDGQHIYGMFMRPAWCIGLSWIVYSSYHNRGGFVNWFLTLSSFQVASRLTYSMYLIHFPLLVVLLMRNMKLKLLFSDFSAMYDWCGVFMTTFVTSIVWVLAFESPMISIEKFIFGSKKKEAPKKMDRDIENVTEEVKNNK